MGSGGRVTADSQEVDAGARNRVALFRYFAFRIWDLGFGFAVCGLRVSGFGFRVEGFRFRASGIGSRASGFGLLGLGIYSSRNPKLYVINPLSSGVGFRFRGPLSSKYGTRKTVKAMYWA